VNTAPRRALDRVRWTLIAVGAGYLPHAFHLPLWVSGMVLATGLWRLSIALRQRPLPGRIVRFAGAVLALIAVLASYRTINGLEAGSALLALMAALKLLETRELRDHVLLVLIGFFLLLAAMLRDQSLWLLPYYALGTWLGLTALFAVTRANDVMPWRRALAMSGRMLLYALPLAAVLFLLFPRVPGPFWALPNATQALSGLGDEMSPGDISDLTLSDAPAFRARFHGAVPPPIERYWRGPVLHDFDGYTWRRTRGQFYPTQPLAFTGPRYSYRVMLEANNRPWLFALDHPVQWLGEDAVTQAFDYQLLLSRPASEAQSFELTSYTRAGSGGDTELAQSLRRRDTRLPESRNPRTRTLAAELRARFPDDRAYVRAVLDLFAGRGFVYTLTPPRLETDAIDDFMFNTRRGFCGHYASAFTVLMRSAGIPARVVTGYQGGVYNRLGDYWYVSQADAHAWSEIWLQGVGWQRVDPTAVVAPDRLERGAEDSLGAGAAASERWLGAAEWLQNIRFAWDAANTWWRDRVLDFDRFKQRALLEWLGLPDPDWRTLGILLGFGFTVFLLWITLALRRDTTPRNRDPLVGLYQRFCKAAARRGIERRPDEGPVDFAERLKLSLPGAAPVIDAFIGSFVRARYLAPEESSNIEEIAHLARAFEKSWTPR
jgi:transglutaminase-like putative cysteine protease